ncbi:hypothetical protein F2Q70_00023848 [Brassica cretica]|uniref:type I protein arginine methyltransferase n=1 Tax=Brassica cretica TaxID=69181 RepID=A0A8S9GXM0_BRACR|nr:hypothetical protein F2Q70_00023848 [Brassica cretica]
MLLECLVMLVFIGSSTVSASNSKFDEKIEASSAKMYFHYYGQLLHQQNMLQDYVRTGTYYAAVMENRSDFAGRVVVDVGAGSGILSMFAAQAGAKHVYAVEASEMAEYARKLIAGNPLFADRITVIKGKVEDIELPEKADVLISEPMGTLLVNERMLESYVIARDRFMSPNGKMFPTAGRIHMAPFSDEFLFIEMANKALFWQQQNYYGVDLTPLFGSAHQGYFSQPVVDAFDPRLLVSPPTFHTIDFTQMKRSFSKGVNIKFGSEKDSKEFCDSFEEWRKDALVPGSSIVSASNSKFDEKIEASSAKMYFHYYGQLLHQQNMLQDYVRTGTYYAAVMENRSDFAGRVVVDVGAGSGILSMFAAQAGAKHVYAVEASEMAEYARKLIAGNPLFADRITVIKGKVEDIELPEKADVLISEPMGTLLINERMLESYVIARDRFMSPNGKMFPTAGRIHMAPFSDEFLFIEMANKALFWQQQNYYGVDLTPLFGSAHQGYFSQPVVDAFDPRLLVSPPTFHTIDFTQMKV